MENLIKKKYKITGKVSYTVKMVDRFEGDTEQTGWCKGRPEYEIQIKKDLSDKEKILCLIHELLHALEFEYKIDIPHKVIYKFERAVFRFLKLNKYI